MKRTMKTLVSAVAGLGFLTSMAADADACGGRGGGGYRGSFGGGHRVNYAPNYYPQEYPQQHCAPQQFPQHFPQQQFPQQQFPQQQFPQQQFPQQQFPQQQFPQQQVPQQQVPQQQVQQQQVQQQQVPQQQFSQQQLPQQQVQQQQVPQQQFSQQQFSQQQFSQQQFSQQGVPQGQAAPVAQNAAPVAQSNGAPQNRLVAKPVSTGGANIAGANAAVPVAAAPQQTPAQPADGSAEMSALQALSDWDGGEQPAADAQATAQATAFNPAGEFVASLANGATVRLHMLEDSTFTWIATNKGKNSSFQGTFTVEGGSLKLLRSSDNQKLEGAFGQTQNGFTFRLSGQTETNMNFVRS